MSTNDDQRDRATAFLYNWMEDKGFCSESETWDRHSDRSSSSISSVSIDDLEEQSCDTVEDF